MSERMLKIGRALIKRKLARVAETLMGRSRACIVGRTMFRNSCRFCSSRGTVFKIL